MKRRGRDILLLLVCGVMVACFCKKEDTEEHTFDKTYEEEASVKENDPKVWELYESFLDNRDVCYLTEEFCTYDRERFYGVGGEEENFKEGQAYFLSGLVEKLANRYDEGFIGGKISFAAIDCGMDGIEELALRFEGLDDWSDRGLILIFCIRDGKLYLCHEFEDEGWWGWNSTELFYSGYMIEYHIYNDVKNETHSCIDGEGNLIFWYKKEFSELWRMEYLESAEEMKESGARVGISFEEDELDYTQKIYDLYQPALEGYLEAGYTSFPDHAGFASYYVGTTAYGALYSNRHQEDYLCVDHAAGEFYGHKDLENFYNYCVEASPLFKERGVCTKEQIEEIIGEQAKKLGISECIAKEPLTWIPIGVSMPVSEDTKEVETEEEPREVHRYEFIVKDVTWQEAYDDCISRGGYLVNINSQEEYKTIRKKLNSGNFWHIKFWIGGKRDLNRDGGQDYYWVDKEGNYGEKVHDKQDTWEPGIWEQGVWLSGEPSIWDKETNEPECFMDMYYQEGRWVWNDVPLDISMYYAGSIGYICEYDP